MSNITAEDHTYRVVGGEPLLGRLYRPVGRAIALIVEVHGGAWVMNDRLANAVIHRHLAESGIAVFALDFRMAPAHRYPAAVQDVNHGIRWIKANAARLGIDTKRFGGLGTSSGGQLMVLGALRPDDSRYLLPDAALAGQDACLEFVMACWPVLDPLARYRMAKDKNLKNLIDAHHAYWPDERAMTEGNPQLIVERGEATSLPPMLVLQGTGDENVEHQRADVFAQRYRIAGGDIELYKFAGQPHTFIVKDPAAPASVEALDKMTDYIAKQTASKRERTVAPPADPSR